MTLDPASDWFDKWIDTYRHPDTKLYASTWTRLEGKPRAIVGIVERGRGTNIYDMERSDAT